MAISLDEDDTITFSSGRQIYVYGHIVGINPELELTYGHDGGIDWPPSEYTQEDQPEKALTSDDMRELADYMIGLWTKFKETL